MFASVLLVTHNHRAYARKAIESVLAQSVRDLELIVVDSGSSDGTPEEFKKIRDERMHCRVIANRGPSHAFNEAFTSAKGEYIAIMSGDDIAFPERLEKQIEVSRRMDGGAVFSEVEFIGENDESIETPAYLRGVFDFKGSSSESWLAQFLVNGNCLNATTFCISAKKLREVCAGTSRPFHPALMQLQDFDLWVRLALVGDITVIEQKLMKYRIRSGNGNLSSPSRKAVRRSKAETFFMMSHLLSQMPTSARVTREWMRDKLLSSRYPFHQLPALYDRFQDWNKEPTPAGELEFASLLEKQRIFSPGESRDNGKIRRAARALWSELKDLE